MQQVQIRLDQTKEFNCKCGSATFFAISFLRVVPALLSPTLKAELMPLPAYRCTECLEIVNFNPDQPQKKT